MSLRKIARLFTIKTRLEAWLVTYAIAVGANVEASAAIATLTKWDRGRRGAAL